MFKWIVFAPARPAAYAFAFALIGALAVIGTGSNSVAEEKKAAPKTQKNGAWRALPGAGTICEKRGAKARRRSSRERFEE